MKDMENLFGKAIGEIERMLNTKTVVGDPITVEGNTLIPLISVGFGFAVGGGEGTDPGKGAGTGGGAGGGGVSPNWINPKVRTGRYCNVSVFSAGNWPYTN